MINYGRHLTSTINDSIWKYSISKNNYSTSNINKDILLLITIYHYRHATTINHCAHYYYPCWSVLRLPLHHPMFHLLLILGLPLPIAARLLSSGCRSTIAVLLAILQLPLHQHCRHHRSPSLVALISSAVYPIAVIITMISNPRQPPLLLHHRHRCHLGSPTATLESSALGA
jgi:hypothetical protein